MQLFAIQAQIIRQSNTDIPASHSSALRERSPHYYYYLKTDSEHDDDPIMARYSIRDSQLSSNDQTRTFTESAATNRLMRTRAYEKTKYGA